MLPTIILFKMQSTNLDDNNNITDCSIGMLGSFSPNNTAVETAIPGRRLAVERTTEETPGIDIDSFVTLSVVHLSRMMFVRVFTRPSGTAVQAPKYTT